MNEIDKPRTKKKETSNHQAKALFLQLIFVVCSVLLTLAANAFAEVFADIAYGLLTFNVCLLTWMLVDKFYLRGIYTLTEIKNGNVAFGIMLFAFIYLLASSFRLF